MAKKSLSLRETVVCPYCQRQGTVMAVYADGTFDVMHGAFKRSFIGRATGKTLSYDSFNGCSKYGPIGSKPEQSVVRLDKEIIEEFDL